MSTTDSKITTTEKEVRCKYLGHLEQIISDMRETVSWDSKLIVGGSVIIGYKINEGMDKDGFKYKIVELILK